MDRRLKVMRGGSRPLLRATALAGSLVLAACSGGKSEQGGSGGAAAHKQSGPAEVGYVVVQPTSAPLTTELSGRTNAYESSDVRPQVNGVIRRRFFTEGALVHKGQALYEIDPSLYRAAVDQAAANLQSAQANAEATRIQAERYKPLAQIQAVSQQDYTNAVASARQGTATVAQNRAALETARINLHYTRVPAPITGRIGRSLFTVGALVTASQTDPLAQIQRLDPMYVDIQQSSADLLALRHALSSREGLEPTRAVVHLTLEDGSQYPYTGTVEFAEALVDQNTGTVTLRARFPNPKGVLLPGMFVRTTFAQAINTNAFLVPQPAITRDPQGNAKLFIVGPGNKAIPRTVKADTTQGPYWVVTSGLNQGDKVIVQGTGQLKPNQPIKPVPANTPDVVKAAPNAGKGGSGGKGGGQGGTGSGQGSAGQGAGSQHGGQGSGGQSGAR